MEDTALILILTAVAALAGGALFSAIALLPDRTRVSPQPPQPPPDTTVSIRAPSSGLVGKTSVSTGRRSRVASRAQGLPRSSNSDSMSGRGSSLRT